jgi:hypothetical protein
MQKKNILFVIAAFIALVLVVMFANHSFAAEKHNNNNNSHHGNHNNDNHGPKPCFKDCEPKGDGCDGPVIYGFSKNHNQNNDCEEPTPTPTETPEVTPTPEQPQTGGWSPEPEGNKSTTNAPGVCSINDIGDVANINVLTGTPNDGMVEVQWSLPQNADKVHIMYGEYGKPYEHALLNTDNDGHEVIGGLKNGVNYNFKVAGVRGCGVGNYSKEFDPMP